MGFDDPMDEDEAFKIARARQPSVHTECWRALKALLRKHDSIEKKVGELFIRIIGKRGWDA